MRTPVLASISSGPRHPAEVIAHSTGSESMRNLALATLATVATLALTTAPAQAAAPPPPPPPTPADAVVWDMNEAAGATVMQDSGPQGLNGVIDPSGVQTGFMLAGVTGYSWVHRPPEQGPPSPERIIQVP